MNPLSKIYYFAIVVMMVPITLIFGLYFSSLIKGTPLIEGGIFDAFGDFLQGNSSITLVASYVCFGLTFVLLFSSIALVLSIYNGSDSSDDALGLKVNDNNRFKSN